MWTKRAGAHLGVDSRGVGDRSANGRRNAPGVGRLRAERSAVGAAVAGGSDCARSRPRRLAGADQYNASDPGRNPPWCPEDCGGGIPALPRTPKPG